MKVVALCAGVAAALGPTWAAQELLQLCLKQVGGACSWSIVVYSAEAFGSQLLVPHLTVHSVDLHNLGTWEPSNSNFMASHIRLRLLTHSPGDSAISR